MCLLKVYLNVLGHFVIKIGIYGHNLTSPIILPYGDEVRPVHYVNAPVLRSACVMCILFCFSLSCLSVFLLLHF